MARLRDYESKDFITIDNGNIIWNGYFYASDGYMALLEYSRFDISIDDFIHKYNWNPDEAYEQYGLQFTQYITKEGEDNNTREYLQILLDNWVDEASPITVEEITEDTPNGFYILMYEGRE